MRGHFRPRSFAQFEQIVQSGQNVAALLLQHEWKLCTILRWIKIYRSLFLPIPGKMGSVATRWLSQILPFFQSQLFGPGLSFVNTIGLVHSPQNDDDRGRCCILIQNLQFAIIWSQRPATLSSDGLGNNAPPIISPKRGTGGRYGRPPGEPMVLKPHGARYFPSQKSLLTYPTHPASIIAIHRAHI